MKWIFMTVLLAFASTVAVVGLLEMSDYLIDAGLPSPRKHFLEWLSGFAAIVAMLAIIVVLIIITGGAQ